MEKETKKLKGRRRGLDGLPNTRSSREVFVSVIEHAHRGYDCLVTTYIQVQLDANN